MGLKFLCLALAAAANGLSVSAPYRPTTSHFAARATTPKLALAGVPLHRSASAEFTATRSRPPVLALRGGLAFVPSTLALPATVDGSFQLIFSVLTAACAALVYGTREKVDPSAEKEVVPTEVRSWQRRFLIVFWLFKMADWLQGPYFYEVYASKIINGVAVSSAGVARLFLTGFGSTALFGAIVGGLVDSLGRKRGSLMFALMYAVSALSTRGNTLPLLFAGRVAGGIGTSLLFSAPEAWLVSEHQKNKFDGKFLGQTFGLAYFGDAIVAIMAGQLAGFVAAGRGPTAPFELSVLFLAAGAAFVTFFWKENFGGKAQAVATSEASGAEEEEASTGGQDSGKLIGEATSAMFEDKKILLVGAVQALFEGAMYIFVLQWPPALKAALGAGVAVPFGKIFSCFMVCCMLGSTTFSWLMRQGKAPENIMMGMLLVAAASMTTATTLGIGGSLVPLIASLFAFEACVGMYFPLIGTLRSKYLPDAYRGVIMNLFGIPLNLIVVGVFLSISKLGLAGAFTCSSSALALAAISQFLLKRAIR